MKNVRGLLSILLALTLVLSLAGTALADDTAGRAQGKITISNAGEGETYQLYRIFDLISYDGDKGLYSYKLSESWKNFTANGYFAVNENGYIQWDEGKDNEAGATAFAQVAIAWAKANEISADKRAVAEGTTLEFTGLELGYYLVESTVGVVCALDTTNPEVNITEKNQAPENEKQVQENSKETEDGGWGKENDANIGDTVYFHSTITITKKGLKNVALHDTMSAGLSFNDKSVNVTVEGKEVTGGEGTWTLDSDPAGGETFVVTFADAYIQSLEAGKKIVVSYSATVNGDAAVAGDGNKNESKVTYGNKGETIKSETTTYTWEVNIFKFTKEGEEKKETALAGAKFVLYKKEGGRNKYATIAKGKITGWVDNEKDATEMESGTDGKISVKGLDSGAYWLKETEAPAGYNKLKNDVSFKIDSEGKVKDTTDKELTDKTLKVENKAGSLLPSTGGMGTAIFYILGGVLLTGAAVMLVVKKRSAG